MSRLDRRQLLARAALGLAAPGLLLRCRRETSPETVARAEELVATLEHPAEAIRLGQVARAVQPQADLATLVAAIEDAMANAGSDDLEGDSSLGARLAGAVRDELAHSRWVRVDDWLLAETEVHLCLLAALLADRGTADGSARS